MVSQRRSQHKARSDHFHVSQVLQYRTLPDCPLLRHWYYRRLRCSESAQICQTEAVSQPSFFSTRKSPRFARFTLYPVPLRPLLFDMQADRLGPD